MKIVDIIINRFISRNLDDVTVNSSESPKENIRLYYRSQMKKQLQEKNLKSITETNLSPVDETKNIQTLIYYKNRKVDNLFLKSHPHKKIYSRYLPIYVHVLRKSVNPTNRILDIQLHLSNSE